MKMNNEIKIVIIYTTSCHFKSVWPTKPWEKLSLVSPKVNRRNILLIYFYGNKNNLIQLENRHYH